MAFGHRALSEGARRLRTPLDDVTARRCCCHRPCSQPCDGMAKCHLTQLPPACANLPPAALSQIHGRNKSFHPVWLGVVIHDALFRNSGEQFQSHFKKDKVNYGNLPLEAKMVSRGAGRSAVAASAYLSCSRMLNDYDGVQHDYTRKQGLAWQAVFSRQWLPRNGRTGKNSGTPWRKRRKPRTAVWRGNLSPRCPSSCHASSKSSFCKILSGSSSWMKGCAPTLRSTTPTATIPTPTSC